MDIVLATRNKDKIREIESILSLDVRLLTLGDFPDVPEIIEDGETMEDNALKKARAVRRFTGMCALADDSGLEVDALGGAPGVYSARYAGEDATYETNNRKVLQGLSDVPPDERSARFRCVMALALDGPAGEALYSALAARGGFDPAVINGRKRPEAIVTEGILEGWITSANRGTSGFGYDPIFEPERGGQTLAEMGLQAKNKISHRYRALVEMRELLLRYGLASER